MFKDRWEFSKGFCQVKRVRCINKDGSFGYKRVSMYIAKYIAKPKERFPWVAEGLCEVPRRLSSVGFGTKDLDLERLKKWYLAVGLSGEGRLERINERKKTISVYGAKFPMPRRISEKLFYDKETKFRYDWKKKKYVDSPVFRRTQLSRMALVYARSRDTEAFGKQLLYDSERNGQPVDWSLLEARFLNDQGSLADREEIAQKTYTRRSKGDSQ